MLFVLLAFLWSGCPDGSGSRLYNMEREFFNVASCRCLSEGALADYRKSAVAELKSLRKCDTLRTRADSLRKLIKGYRP